VTCSHGSDENQLVQADYDSDKTLCCGAFTSFHIDDGSEYCKCCYGTVVGHVKEGAHP
jgi:hypothetical protein